MIVQGVPLDMVNTNVSTSLVDNINASLPEGYPVPDFNPEYISDGIETNIILNELADVWVTFIGEGAGYKNVLGFYTYDLFDPPQGPPSDEDITIIFPNVSAAGSGGGLIIGDKVYLGQYPANTGIGWVLIANGWNGSNVTYGNWVLYSNPYWNPEGSSDLQKHNVNLFDNNEQVVVFGFEDIRRDFGSCDQDFNDAIFLVTTNPYNAIDTENFNSITYDGGGQSSGGDGGLESNRGLSTKIAKRAFDRTKNGTPIKEINEIATRDKSQLELYVPESLKARDNRVVSSPVDLKSFTKADDVWSADFQIDGKTFATVFSTMTNDGVYDHTKVVCDRLSGSTIKEIKEVIIDNDPFLLTTLETEEGSLEYSISFSIEIINQQSYRMSFGWAVDQFPKFGKFMNYQSWSSAPFLTKDIVKQIISSIDQDLVREQDFEYQDLKPTVYIKSGEYLDNAIILNINNTFQENQLVNLVGTTTKTELDDTPEQYFESMIAPPGESIFQIENDQKSIFDLEIKISTEGMNNYDVAYFSDGAWAMDYETTSTQIMNFEIEKTKSQNENNDYLIQRDISVDFVSSDYITVYKNLRPSRRPVDLSEFNGLKFIAEGEGALEVKMIKSSVENWGEHFYHTIELEDGINEVQIPFSYFRNKVGDKLSAEDLMMVTFTQKNLDGKLKTLKLSDLRFTGLSEGENLVNDVNDYFISPNPNDGNFKLIFESATESSAQIFIYNNQGVKVRALTKQFHKGLNNKQLKLQNLPKGMYWLNIEREGVVSKGQKFIIG